MSQRLRVLGTQTIATLASNTLIKPKTNGVGANVKQVDLYIDNTGAADIYIRQASGAGGFRVPTGETRWLLGLEADDDVHEVSGTSGEGCELIFYGPTNPAN